MAPEKQMKEGRFSQITARQKGIAVAIIVIILILIWQVMGIIKGSEPAPVIVTTKTKVGTNPAKPPGSTSTVAPVHAEQTPELRQVAIVNEPQFLKLQKLTEEKYIGKLNELEELRIQRQIAETNQAISAAKLATVTAEKSISDLLTRPTAPPVPLASYANELVSPTRTGGPIVPIPEAPLSIPSVEYTLISVSMQLNKWNAVLGYQGKFFSVNIGDVLPPDGSIITGINKNNVVLKKDGHSRKVNIVSSI